MELSNFKDKDRRNEFNDLDNTNIVENDSRFLAGYVSVYFPDVASNRSSEQESKDTEQDFFPRFMKLNKNELTLSIYAVSFNQQTRKKKVNPGTKF